MIDEKLAAKYDLPPIKEYSHGEHDWYWTFLIQSDRDTLTAIEEQMLGADLGQKLYAACAGGSQYDSENEADSCQGADSG